MSPTDPPDEVIAPLSPNLWRLGSHTPGLLDQYPRILGFGAQPEVIVGTAATPPPYEDYARWEANVMDVALGTQGQVQLWDMWNEPDFHGNFGGTRAQFFETYRRGYVVLREELGPDVWIGGPSISTYDPQFMTEFLDFCLANDCMVNFLCWHENQSTGSRIPGIANHLADAFARFVNNPDYAGLQIAQIQINEIIGQSDQYRSAEIWGTLDTLERAGAAGACKACWGANCDNNTLNGLVTPGTPAPLASWWAYKLYADGVAARVDSSSSDPQVTNLPSAASAADDTAQVLVGYFGSSGSTPSVLICLELDNLGALPFLAKADSALVGLWSIPDSEDQELSAPVFLGEEILPIDKAGTIAIALPALDLHEGFQLTIQSAAGCVPRRRSR